MSQPLYTLTALDFLTDILRPEWRVFEYGSGRSTTWYVERCAEVHAVEHSGQWHNEAGKQVGDGVVALCEADAPVVPDAQAATDRFWQLNWELPRHLDGIQTQYHGMDCDSYQGYASEIYRWPCGHFDLVAVDGMARSLCLYHAVNMVHPDGWIVLDNSCRWQYNDAQQWAQAQGWHRRDFWQPGHPGYCTSFFSRSFEASDDPEPRRRDQGDLYHAIGW